MRTRTVLLVLVAFAALSGCLSGEEAPEADEEPELDQTDAPGGEQGEEVQTDAEQGPIEEVQAPEWETGDWFTYEVDHQLGPSAEVTLVVTDVSSGSYTLAWADPEEALPTLTYHFPPVGEVQRPNLGWWMHGETGTIVDFPLEDGKTWTATFSGEEYDYEATFTEGEEGLVVDIRGESTEGEGFIEATYDPRVGFFTSLERTFEEGGPASPGVELVDSCARESLPVSTAYEVTPEDLAYEFVAGPNLEEQQPPFGGPAGTFSVSDELDRVLVASFLGGGEGAYEASVIRPPAGVNVYQNVNDPGSEGMELAYSVFEDPEPGSWSYTASAGGPGIVILEAMGVSLEEVPLDQGAE